MSAEQITTVFFVILVMCLLWAFIGMLVMFFSDDPEVQTTAVPEETHLDKCDACGNLVSIVTPEEDNTWLCLECAFNWMEGDRVEAKRLRERSLTT